MPAESGGAVEGLRRPCHRLSEAVGNTPMVCLGPSVGRPRHSEAHRSAAHWETHRSAAHWEVWAKLEYLNPMGSVKDRIARHMVETALASGELRPGGTLVEASSGSTAMGLAMMAIERGLGCKLVVRRQTSPAKLDALRALGVELVLVDGTLPPEHPESYNRKAHQVAAETPGAYFPDQHNNRRNNEAHYLTTGPEIWRQTGGRIDVFVAGIGTGGTISGTGRYLKERNPKLRVVAVDIEGSVFTDHFHGRPLPTPAPYLTEGLGDEEIIACPEFEVIDEMIQVSDREAAHAARELARSEAIFAGSSSGAILAGLRRVLRDIEGEAEEGRAPAEGPVQVVTLFPDSGQRYLSTIYNDEWMREKGLLDA